MCVALYMHHKIKRFLLIKNDSTNLQQLYDVSQFQWQIALAYFFYLIIVIATLRLTYACKLYKKLDDCKK